MKLEQISELCYEVNRAICAATGDPSFTVNSWDTAESYQKSAVRTGVANQLNDPAGTPEESHKRWCEYMRSEGWVFDAAKDVEQKTHPCLVPFSELPPEQRVKDCVFLAIVNVCRSSMPKNSAME